MKAQDIVFLAILITFLVLRRPKLAVALGMVCLAMSIPLFAAWVFFTAERLTWYAAGFFLLSIALVISRDKKGD